jgi:hypothetical protein
VRFHDSDQTVEVIGDADDGARKLGDPLLVFALHASDHLDGLGEGLVTLFDASVPLGERFQHALDAVESIAVVWHWPAASLAAELGRLARSCPLFYYGRNTLVIVE